MATSSQQQEQLIHLLNAEMETARQLEPVLESEHDALSRGDAEAILSLSEEKRTVMERMQKQLAMRNRFLQSIGLPPGREGTEQMAVSGNDRLAAAWQNLHQLIERLNQQNTINGGIVVLSHRFTRQAIDLLSGKQPNSDTYGPSGEQRSGTASISLAKV
jgi:flagellar biosynthesis/type III secretory pathway chaperone